MRLLYPRLAIQGITKNRRIYIPYLLSSVGMVMMFYIMDALYRSPLLSNIRGGTTATTILGLGRFVVAVFAAIFLFYTNSFLTRRRYKEFGLYNILGMDKRKIGFIVFFESLYVSIVGIIGGVALGILFSKFAEMGIVNAMEGDIDYKLRVPLGSVGLTFVLFAAVFSLLMIKSLIAVRKYKPLELLKSEKAGEKPPRANYVFAIAGIAILGIAYYIALSIKNPVAAITYFFLAVVLVIVATYLLFIAGSVALCKILQKNKNYYYQKQHFVSVSSMAYRMRRNGAGLASICILSTMVLVMISSTSSLYFGKFSAIERTYPHDLEMGYSFYDPSILDSCDEVLDSRYQKFFEHENIEPQDYCSFPFAYVVGTLKDGNVQYIADEGNFNVTDFDTIHQYIFVTADVYNETYGEDISLSGNEAILLAENGNYDRDTIVFGDVELTLKARSDNKLKIGLLSDTMIPSLTFVISDFDVLTPLYEEAKTGDVQPYELYYVCAYNVPDLSEDEQIELFQKHMAILDEYSADSFPSETPREGLYQAFGYMGQCKAGGKSDFISTFGALFFLGITLSALFIFAAAVIIYYKQITEGYEDKARFAIMKKVGMSKDDIKKSINSQILTVFFAPLILSGAHLCFAFPVIWKLLKLFQLSDIRPELITTAIAFVAFALFYALIYKVTARAYYNIVSSDND